MTLENKTWFVSDLHFGHKNIIEYCDRPTTIEELDEWLINKLNSSISENDTVYHIGDFTLKSKNLEYIVSIVSKLNGNWNFVLGNHDDEKTLDKLCAAMPDKCKNLGWYHIYKTKKRKLILHHFPHRSWQDARHGSIDVHGHCHGSLKGKELHNQIDVGIDALDDFNPITLEQLIQIVDERNKNNEVVNHHEGQKTGNE